MLQLFHLYKTLVMIIDNIIKLCHTTKYKNIRHKSKKIEEEYINGINYLLPHKYTCGQS